jgi:hypothetical protein
MSLKIASIQRTLYNWMVRETDGVIDKESIIWRDGSEALPPRPCVTMKIVSGPQRVGLQDNLTYISGNQFNIGGQRVMVLSVQIFGNRQIGPMAYQLGLDLNSGLSKLTVLDHLRAGGIAVQGQGQVNNITALEESEYEERAQFDVTLGVAQNVVDDPGIIETAVLTPDVTGP